MTNIIDKLERADDLLAIAKDHDYSDKYVGTLLRANLDLLEPNTRPLPQPSELVEDARTALIATAEAAATHLKRALAAEAHIAKLQADGDKLAVALGVIAPLLDYLPHPHCVTAIDATRQALTEWKD